MKPLSNDNIETGLLDSKIRRRLNQSLSMDNPPTDGKQRLLREVIYPSAPEKKAFKIWESFVEFFMQTEDPESIALLQTFALSKARVFGLPGSQSLHMI